MHAGIAKEAAIVQWNALPGVEFRSQHPPGDVGLHGTAAMYISAVPLRVCNVRSVPRAFPLSQWNKGQTYTGGSINWAPLPLLPAQTCKNKTKSKKVAPLCHRIGTEAGQQSG